MLGDYRSGKGSGMRVVRSRKWVPCSTVSARALQTPTFSDVHYHQHINPIRKQVRPRCWSKPDCTQSLQSPNKDLLCLLLLSALSFHSRSNNVCRRIWRRETRAGGGQGKEALACPGHSAVLQRDCQQPPLQVSNKLCDEEGRYSTETLFVYF